MSANIGWLFYKDYFKDINYKNLKSKENEQKVQKKIDNIINISIQNQDNGPLGNTHFKATTTYPGMLLGSGYIHELPFIEAQAILGFDFDYTTGLPIIRGSSIKGVLRSAFKHPKYIKELLNDESIDIGELEKDIFQNNDIFFDAVIISSGKVLGDDYLAPHKNSKKKKDSNGNLVADELCNPTPLRFIKVMPNVTFRFDFYLNDGIISRMQKALLFASILEDLGIGAKTNVGYGKFLSGLNERAKNDILEFDEEKKRLEEIKKEQELKRKEEQEIANLDSNLEKVKIKIKNFNKQKTKDIYDVIIDFELDNNEKNELIQYLETLIGPKPAPKNKASIKWAIKVYELLGA